VIDLISQERDQQYKGNKVKGHEPMGYRELHAEERSAAATVRIKIIQNCKHEENRYDGIQNDKEEIIDFRSLETRLVKSLDVKNNNMSHQKKRKYPEVVLEIRNALCRVDRNDVPIKPKKIRVEIGKSNSKDITEEEQPDQTTSLPFDHRSLTSSFHFSLK
jgi:hypothetical protein